MLRVVPTLLLVAVAVVRPAAGWTGACSLPCGGGAAAAGVADGCGLEDEECDAIVALQTVKTVNSVRTPGQESDAVALAALQPEGDAAVLADSGLPGGSLRLGSPRLGGPAPPLRPLLLSQAPLAPWVQPAAGAGARAVLAMAQDLRSTVAQSRASREESAHLRQEILAERKRQEKAELLLVGLRANATRLHRAVVAARAAGGGGVGTHDRKVMLISVSSACAAVLLCAVLGCACAASSSRRVPAHLPPPGFETEAAAASSETATGVETAAGAADSFAGAPGEAGSTDKLAADPASTVDSDIALSLTAKRKKRWRQGKICTAMGCVLDGLNWASVAAVVTFRDAPICLYECLFGCSPQICIASWIFAVLWGAAMCWLWHVGVVQPYLQQLLVYVYFVLGFGSLVIVFMLEYLTSFQTMFRVGYKTVMKFHDKIDDALESIGLDYLESEQDRLDAEAARNSSRAVDEAHQRTAERRANDGHRKPAPGTPAWAISFVRGKSKGGACC